MELFQTNKGLKPKFLPGDRVGKLIVQKYIRKRHFPQTNTYEPMYECKCDCGNTTVRRQRYLQYKLTSTKCCEECGKNAIRNGARKGGKAERKESNYSEQMITREEKVQRIIDEVFKFTLVPTFEGDANDFI